MFIIGVSGNYLGFGMHFIIVYFFLFLTPFNKQAEHQVC